MTESRLRADWLDAASKLQETIMTDQELLTVLKGLRDQADKQAQDLAKLKAAGVDVETDDGTTLDDMIQREYDASQRLERTMATIRSRLT